MINQNHSPMKSSYFRDSEGVTENFIITGGLDDLIKVWQLDNGKLEVRHQLEGHSLGVISVAVSPDGKSKTRNTYLI